MERDVKIGLTSYRYPESHREFPWHEFLSICDFVNQQVYWEQAHNPAYQLDRSIQQYNQLLKEIGKNIPQHPIGAAYSERGWKVTERDLRQYMERCVELGLPSTSLWVWDEMRARSDPELEKLWDLYAAFDFKEPAPPPDYTPEEKLELLWKAHEELHHG
jgi:hypothetical protein